jgi:hypothetical protein
VITRASIALLALAGPAATAAALAPCDVLTEGDLRAALGGAWQSVEPIVSKDEACAYKGESSSFATLLLTEDSAGADVILAARRQMAGDKAKSADGPGTGAYRFNAPNANVIVFGKGNWVAQIEVAVAASKDPAKLDRLARAAYDRLP